ncbi:MAG: NmrA family protein [Fusobacteria bacterium]|nr:MAG: NmrA family protein [Fusobacteriota bacterium]KAF0228511.1 MAG: NmrA family [Fusobacteriota bacterium]
MKVLVTGASGNVGYHVVNQLLKLGEEVTAAGPDTQKIQKIFGNKVSIVELDFTKPETFDNALYEVDRIFLMRPPHLGSPDDIYPFIEKAKNFNIKLISFLSLMGIEKNTIPPHFKIEKFIEKSGIPYAHIRPGFFMQNLKGVHAIEIKEKDMIFIPAGNSKTSFIDAEDIGLAIATIMHNPLKHKNTAYTITGAQALDYYQIADILSNLTKRKITYAKPGLLKYRNYYIKKRGLNRSYVNVTVALYIMTRLGTAKGITNEFFKLTGKQPRTFEEFARNNIEAFSK